MLAFISYLLCLSGKRRIIINEGVSNMPKIIVDLEVDRVDLVDEGANSEAYIRLYKRKEHEPTMNLEEILAKMKPEHVEVVRAAITAAAETNSTELAKAKEDLTASEAKLAKVEADLHVAKEEVAKSKPKAADEFEEILKSASPEVAAFMKTMKVQKDLAEEAARVAIEKARNDEVVAKAKTLTNLPVEQDALVTILKGASTEVLELLEKANSAIETSLLTEVGKSKGNAPSGLGANAAWGKLEKRASEIAARDKITVEKAMGVAMREHPDLYKEYVDGGAN
jgi:hypothetical protein